MTSSIAEKYPLPSVTVDILAWTVLESDLKILLIKRKLSPFLGAWALPGGFVRVGPSPEEQGEGIEEAAERELLEETHLRPGSVSMRQLGAFGPAGRDPRTRVITIAHWCTVKPELAAYVRAGTDAAEVAWFSWSHVGEIELAFDHRQILERGHERLREEVEFEGADAGLTAARFSMAELRAIHEAVRGDKLDPPNFRRQFLARVAQGEAVATDGSRVTGRRRAAVYKWARAAVGDEGQSESQNEAQNEDQDQEPISSAS